MRDIAVDAHHHFWDPARGDFPWMQGDAMAPIRRAFAPEHLAPLLRDAGIARSVVVQTQSSEAETRDFLALAAGSGFVAGVVGWVDLASPGAHDAIARLKAAPGGAHLVGIRHQVHDEPDPRWLLREDVRRGLAAVEAHGLAYDLLLRPREIPAALETVAALIAERGEDDKIWGSMVKQALKRRNPGFNESYYGFRAFSDLLEEAAKRKLLVLERDDKSGGYVVRPA